MQSNKQVLRAMVESEEVSLQATTEAREGFCCSKCDREVIPQFWGSGGRIVWDKWIFIMHTLCCHNRQNCCHNQTLYRVCIFSHYDCG